MPPPINPAQRRQNLKVWRATTSAPSQTCRYRRKSKLKMRFKDNLDHEIARTQEKLELLQELKAEIENASQE